MLIGLVYGGQGAEEFTNLQATKDIERVLLHYSLKIQRIYLNNPKFKQRDIEKINLFLIIDSNSKNRSNREILFNRIKSHKIDYISQKQSALLLARNKFKSNNIFKRHGLNIPNAFLFSSAHGLFKKELNKKLEDFITNNGFPLVLKDNFGSSSENLRICFSQKEFLDFLSYLSKICSKVLIERYIPGVEVTVPRVMFFGKAYVLNPIQINYRGYLYDYKIKNKTFQDKLKIPPSLPQKTLQEIKTVTIKANNLIGSSYYSRVDMKIDGNTIYILEVNGEPVLSKNDFISRSLKSIGVSYPKFVFGLLSNSELFTNYLKHKNKEAYKFMIRAKDKILAIN
ncbi:ATP-grasp domain-containing protein [Candidatus Berkelbacteria bacterium]|nr:ATP-grasp domain-containing protein [Candidatus Berkelbacteria bacterium]